MATAPVVKALQEFEDLALHLLAALERGALQQFAFDCGEQALGHGAIETAAYPPHRSLDAGLGATLAERQRRVLAAAVGMEHRAP